MTASGAEEENSSSRRVMPSAANSARNPRKAVAGVNTLGAEPMSLLPALSVAEEEMSRV